MDSLLSIPRRAAERLSARVVLRRRLPKQFKGLPIYVTPGCGLRYWGDLSKFDSMLYRMAEELAKPKAVVWDVGANVGLFTFCAAALSGRGGYTVAIEPDRWLCELIQRSSVENRDTLGEVAIENVAIAAASGTSYLEISNRSRAFNRVTASIKAGVPIKSVTLDSLLTSHPPPTVLKIDVESYEVEVLMGATRVLEDHHPAIWCEVEGRNSQGVSDILHGAGYTLFSSVTGRQIPKANWHTLAVYAGNAKGLSETSSGKRVLQPDLGMRFFRREPFFQAQESFFLVSP